MWSHRDNIQSQAQFSLSSSLHCCLVRLVCQVASPAAATWLLTVLGIQTGTERLGPSCSTGLSSPGPPVPVPADTLQLVLDILQMQLVNMSAAADGSGSSSSHGMPSTAHLTACGPVVPACGGCGSCSSCDGCVAADGATSIVWQAATPAAAVQHPASAPDSAGMPVMQLKANCWTLLSRVMLLAACQPAPRPLGKRTLICRTCLCVWNSIRLLIGHKSIHWVQSLHTAMGFRITRQRSVFVSDTEDLWNLLLLLCWSEPVGSSSGLLDASRAQLQHSPGSSMTPGLQGSFGGTSSPNRGLQRGLSARSNAAAAGTPVTTPGSSRRPPVPLLALPNSSSSSRPPSVRVLTAGRDGGDASSCLGTPLGRLAASCRPSSSAPGRCNIWQVLVELMMVNGSAGQAVVLQHMAKTHGNRLLLPLQQAVRSSMQLPSHSSQRTAVLL